MEIAATNGMLSAFDSGSVLLDPRAFPVSGSKTLDAARVLAGPRKVGYLPLSVLARDAAAATSEALRQFAREGVVGIVLDLRGNAGGLFEQASKVVDAFARRGVIVSTVGRAGRTVTEARADGTEPVVPLVVITDHRTSAGGALVAAALRELSGATLLGATTDANTSLQWVFDISSPLDVLQKDAKLALKLTSAHWRLAGDRSIEETGVIPDVAIDPSVLALEEADGAGEPSPAIAAARDALVTAPTSDRAAVIAAARAAVKAVEIKALPGRKI
jgi:carboxyl-terminal processing protease